MEQMGAVQRQKLVAYWNACRQALAQLLQALGADVPQDCSLEEMPALFDAQRSRLGGGDNAARILQSNKDQFTDLLTELRRVVDTAKNQGDSLDYFNRAELSALRLLDILGRFKETNPKLTYSAGLPGSGGEGSLASVSTQQQLRALELIVRSLINEAYVTQDALRKHFGAINQALVAQWDKSAEKNNLLSGAMFGQLITLFIDKNEYPKNYQQFYQDAPFLDFLKEKRKTLETFFEDIRYIRNQVAHHKNITDVQVALLDRYYQQIVQPLQQAFDSGRTGVNPDQYRDGSQEELKSYFSSVEAKLGKSDAKLDIIVDDVKTLGVKLDELSGAVDKVNAGVIKVNKKLAWGLTGLVAVIVIGVATLGTSTKTLTNTEVIKGDTGDIKMSVGKAKQESSTDPRKELANRGMLWNTTYRNSAIRDNDLESVTLYLSGGMKWSINDEVQSAVLKDKKELIDLLLKNKNLLERHENSCNGIMLDAVRRRDMSLPHVLADVNETQKKFIKNVCNTPDDVASAKWRLDDAKRAQTSAKKQMEVRREKYGDVDVCRKRLLVNDGKALKSQIEERRWVTPGEFDHQDLIDAAQRIASDRAYTLSMEEIFSLVKNYCNDKAKSINSGDNFDWEVEGYTNVLSWMN